MDQFKKYEEEQFFYNNNRTAFYLNISHNEIKSLNHMYILDYATIFLILKDAVVTN